MVIQGCMSPSTYYLEDAILRDSTVVPLAMITMRKSIHGFPLVSYMSMGLCYYCMIALIGHIVTANSTSCGGLHLVTDKTKKVNPVQSKNCAWPQAVRLIKGVLMLVEICVLCGWRFSNQFGIVLETPYRCDTVGHEL